MKLRELDAVLYRYGPPNDYGSRPLERVSSLAAAQAIMFACPKCYSANGGPGGTHSVLVSFHNRGVPADADQNPRWAVSGTSLDDLTLAPSIAMKCGCWWHGWIRDGDAA